MPSTTLTFSQDLELLAQGTESFISISNPKLFIASRALS